MGLQRDHTKPAGRSFAYHLNHELASARLSVKFDKDNLLPRPEHEPAVGERNGQRWTKEGCADMTRAVVIPPAQMMAVFAIPWGQFLEEAIEISQRARFEFNRGQARRRPNDEDRRDASREAAVCDGAADEVGDVVRVSLSKRADFVACRPYHGEAKILGQVKHARDTVGRRRLGTSLRC